MTTLAHQRLATALLGRWTGTEHRNQVPWDPRGGEAVARVRNTSAVGGAAVVQEYEQSRGGVGAVHALGVFRCDAATSEVVLWWLDSLAAEPRELRGRFDGERLTLVSPAARGQARVVYEFDPPDKYSYTLEASPDGADWQLYLDGAYRRDGS